MSCQRICRRNEYARNHFCISDFCQKTTLKKQLINVWIRFINIDWKKIFHEWKIFMSAFTIFWHVEFAMIKIYRIWKNLSKKKFDTNYNDKINVITDDVFMYEFKKTMIFQTTVWKNLTINSSIKYKLFWLLKIRKLQIIINLQFSVKSL